MTENPTSEETKNFRRMLENCFKQVHIMNNGNVSGVNTNMSPVNDTLTIMSTSDYTRAWVPHNSGIINQRYIIYRTI